MIPIAHLSLGDPTAAAVELERAVKDGCRGGFVVPFAWTHKAHGDPAHDPIFAKAVELDVPIAIHPAFEPFELRSPRFENGHRLSLLAAATAGDGVRHAFTTFFDFATFDRFAKLKLVLLESGAGWIGYWLDRLDGVATGHHEADAGEALEALVGGASGGGDAGGVEIDGLAGEAAHRVEQVGEVVLVREGADGGHGIDEARCGLMVDHGHRMDLGMLT